MPVIRLGKTVYAAVNLGLENAVVPQEDDIIRALRQYYINK